MSVQDSHNDDTLIDKLVDGELTLEERRQLLVDLESQPDGWRRCALAFIEAQTWRTELRRVMNPVASERGDHHGEILTAEAHPPAAARRSGNAWRISMTSLAVAAGLLLAFGLGRQIGVGERTQLGHVQIADSAGAPTMNPDIGEEVQKPAEGLDGDAVTLVVNDRHGVPHRVRVPLVEARELGAEFAEVPTWTSPELVRRLDQRGLGLAARRRYAPLYFEQENQRIPFVVPVDDAVVTPVSRPVY